MLAIRRIYQNSIAMISFIVTTYNLEDWLLRRCLSSIVSQGLARDEYEIVVVDDESVISPQHIVDEYATQADVSLYIQQHARQGAARNLALQHARGEWIEFVDGDDYLFAGTVAPVLNVAKKHDLDLLMFGFREVSDEKPIGNVLHVPEVAPCSITTGNDYMYRHNLFGSCCMQLFRRQLLDEPRFGAPLRFTEDIYIEDEEFVTRLVWRAQRMAKVDVPVYAYYQRADSTVHSRSAEHIGELFRNYFVVLERLIDFENTIGGEPHEGVTRKIRFLAVDILRRALREHNWKERWQQSTLQLRALELFPIPVVGYSFKYRAFCLLAQCGIGRYLLRLLEKQG